jgi:response regulator RpfG family c-di-GMP phosphodiesterase
MFDIKKYKKMKKINILYVDDELMNLELFTIVFNEKFNIIIAKSGQEGLEKIEQNKDISVVISDMHMPEMNGIEFINKVKSRFDNIICYILTGFEITEEIADALNQNIIQKYFKKPFNAKEIENAIINI